MTLATLPVLGAWSNFYVVTGSAAASLTGLMFVVVTLVGENRSQSQSATNEGMSTFSSPTVVHFCAAFLVSALLSAPWRSLEPVAVILGLTGIAGVAYVVNVLFKAKGLTAYEPIAEDWIWYVVLPLLAYCAVAAGAVLLPRLSDDALFVFAGTALSLVFIGIHNAWDVVTYIAIQRVEKK